MNPNSNTLDKQLARLADETTLEERFEILKTLVEYWRGEIEPSDAYSPDELEGISIPAALENWFLWAGKFTNIMNGQNFLLEPSELDTCSIPFIFHEENQYCYVWATTNEEEDPPVYGREDESDPWQLEGLRVSEHLILTCIFESILHCADHRVRIGWLEEPQVAFLREHIPPVPLSPWHWLETTFYAGLDRFMFTTKNYNQVGTNGYTVWIGSKTEPALDFLKEIEDETWHYL